jgi:hypothetical protein
MSQPTQEKTNDDVVMGDAASADTLAQKPQDDENLPSWLVVMIKYLRGVAEDTVWQNLVTEFVKFEKGGPPNGVSSFIIFYSSGKLKLTINRTCLRSFDPRRSPTGSRARRRIWYLQSSQRNSALSSWTGG